MATAGDMNAPVSDSAKGTDLGDESTKVKDADKDEVTIKETVIQQTLTTEVTRRELTATTSNNDPHSDRRKSDESKGSQPPTPTPSSFGLDMSSTLPPLPPPMESKYRKALRRLYTQLPERLSQVEALVDELFSKEIVTEAELQELRVTNKNEGKISHCKKLVDILRSKHDDEIEQWLDILEADMRQKPVADWIRQTADKCVEESMQLQVHRPVQRNSMKRSRRDSDSDDDYDNTEVKQPKLDLELILRTIPTPKALPSTNTVIAAKNKHLLISIKYYGGRDHVTNYIKQHLHKLKSEVINETEIKCSCRVEDERTEESKACSAMVSVGFLAGEREAFEILESRLMDFESYVMQQTAELVSITEGCIRIKLSVKSLSNLELLYSDLESGDFLCRITEFLHHHGYAGSEERPTFMLLADDFQLQKIRESLCAVPERVTRRGVKHIKTLMESVESSLKNPKHDLDLIIRTIPKSTCTSEDFADIITQGKKGSHIGRKGPLLMSVKYIKGTDEVTDYVKHSIYKMKSQVSKSLNVPCGCITEDLRTRTDEAESAVVSVGFEAGEKEAYKILESNMDDFEEYVLNKTASVVKVIEGCIKITVRFANMRNLKLLYKDIRSGELLHRIVAWLSKHGYGGSTDRPILLLTVDEVKIRSMILSNICGSKDVDKICIDGSHHDNHSLQVEYKEIYARPERVNRVKSIEAWQQSVQNQSPQTIPVVCV